MAIWIAFFRGINVGGNNLLPMKALAALLEKQGCTEVVTYIQSGNAVFRHKEGNAAKLSGIIRRAIEAQHGFAPHMVLLRLEELERAAASNPFSHAEQDPKSLHVFFLTETPPSPDMRELESVKAANEAFFLQDRLFYLHAPDGIGRSKLAAKAERLLGVGATARNWNTVSKMLELARGCE
ncbi:MAG TPA: DUF1697 domain-containing protein [Rickettsiales bacterium]|nr:DUF1697 domain-containing protein [Rickettsiales bacterium]